MKNLTQTTVNRSLNNAVLNVYDFALTDDPREVAADLQRFDCQFQNTTIADLVPFIESWQGDQADGIG